MTTRTPYVISGAKGDWEVVMGLEVHAQVASNSKLFSGAPTNFGGYSKPVSKSATRCQKRQTGDPNRIVYET